MSVPRSLTLANTNEEFSFTDSSYSAEFRVGRSLPLVPNMDFQATFGVGKSALTSRTSGIPSFRGIRSSIRMIEVFTSDIGSFR